MVRGFFAALLTLLFRSVQSYADVDGMLWYLGILVFIQSCSLVDISDDHTRAEEMQ